MSKSSISQKDLFDDLDNENEDDLSYKLDHFDQAVIWGTDWTTETITSQLFKKNIDLKPKFQRRDAWTAKAKSKFIESLILGLPIPQIILAERKDLKGKYIVIDGKQRLLTIRRFFAKLKDDDFDPFKLSGLTILSDLNGMYSHEIIKNPRFSNIIDQLQNQTIRTTVIRNWPDESFLFTVFLRLNTGSIQLSPQELRQALHPGDFIDFADSYSLQSDAIRSMLRIEAPDFRMRDVEIVIRFFNLKYFITEYDGNLKTAFDNTVKKLNESWSSKKNQIIKDAKALEDAINFTIEVFGQKEAFSKWNGTAFQGKFNRAVFDIMVYYFSDNQILEKARRKKSAILTAFKSLSQKDHEFQSSLEQTTKSITNTELRLRVWGERLSTILAFGIKVPYLDRTNRIALKKTKNA